MKTNIRFQLLIAAILICLTNAVGVFGQTDISVRGMKTELKPQIPVSVTDGCADGWDTAFAANNINGRVEAVASDAAGNIYIGGKLLYLNGVYINGILKWDGNSWAALGSGLGGIESVRTIAASGTDIYVGGKFTSAGGSAAYNIAKWDGNSWSALGGGLGTNFSSFVSSIVVSNGIVYAGGEFFTNGGAPANRTARWDGVSWAGMSNELNNGFVYSLVMKNGTLYAGGSFTKAGTTDVFGVAKLEGNSWSPLATAGTVGTLAANTSIKALAFSGNDLYATGNNIEITGRSISKFAKWNGTDWMPIAYFAFEASPLSLAVVGTDVYVGGFLSPGFTQFYGLAKWDGANWSGLNGGLGDGGVAYSLTAAGNTLLVGGNFETAAGVGAKNVVKFTSGVWSGFYGSGINGTPNAIAVSGADVYVGGNFTTAGTVTANKIAKWNSLTNTWSPMGSGITGSNNSIWAIAVAGNKVYAGGNFSNIGGTAAGNIAVWNGSNWSALGTGVSGTVRAIKVIGEDVYVGGDFQTAGGVSANRIAKWNGSSWSGMNSAIIPSGVTSIAASGNDLYVGSQFTSVNNPNYFLKYDGTNWTALGNGMTGGGVDSIAVSGGDVYVTGGFTSVGGISAARIAKWNGSSWSALGSGIPGNSNIARVASLGADIIAVGDFTVAGGIPANRIAKWNGSDWSALGSGLNDYASVVTTVGGAIYVGGIFTTAGCNSSPLFARWRGSQWTGSGGSDWHSSANWSDGNVPTANASVTISSNNAVISTADVTLSELIVSGGRTITLGSGRTLTINGRLDLANGSLNGAGSLVVNGDLHLTDGNITGLGQITVNGNLYLGSGNIAGVGSVSVTACRSSAIDGGNSNSFVDARLTRCVDSAGLYRFPIGSNGVYAPLELSGITGGGNFTVEPKTGAHPGSPSGLPANRLQRWWSVTNSGITRADMTFQYVDSEVVGNELRYKIFGINGGTAEVQPTTVNTASNRATAAGVTPFSAFTLADGPSTPQLLKGRIRAASGRGAEGVIVKLIDQSGNIRYAMTNPSGYYRFQNVLTWENYTVQVSSKKFKFNLSSRTFEFPENPADVNFTANNH